MEKIYCRHRGYNPGPSGPMWLAILTELPRPSRSIYSRTIYEWRISKDLEQDGHDLIKILPRYFLEGLRKPTKIPWRFPVPRPKFDLAIIWMQVLSVTAPPPARLFPCLRSDSAGSWSWWYMSKKDTWSGGVEIAKRLEEWQFSMVLAVWAGGKIKNVNGINDRLVLMLCVFWEVIDCNIVDQWVYSGQPKNWQRWNWFGDCASVVERSSWLLLESGNQWTVEWNALIIVISLPSFCA
jgi:hypothetical protein